MLPSLTGTEVLIRDELVRLLPELDALIFDIDGVLMDVAESFPVVVCETARFYIENILEWKTGGTFVQPSEIDMFKRAGGFNADEDLTTAIILFFLVKSVRNNSQVISDLRESDPSLTDFARKLADRGGGLMAAEAVLLENLPPQQRREVTGYLNARLILQLFREIYGGVEWCARLYGFHPEYIQDAGYVDKEKILLDVQRLPGRSVSLGVVSGRTREETQLVIEKLALQAAIPPEYTITVSDGLRKPDPKTLRELRDRMKFRRAVFIGDSLDDLRTVNGYRELPGSRKTPVHSCQVLSGAGGKDNQKLFLENSAEIIAPDVNAFLTWFKNARGGK